MDLKRSTVSYLDVYNVKSRFMLRGAASIPLTHIILSNVSLTLSAHAQRGYSSWVCLSVCWVTYHLTNEQSSYKGICILGGI